MSGRRYEGSSSVRRSKRERQQVYSTLDENVITNSPSTPLFRSLVQEANDRYEREQGQNHIYRTRSKAAYHLDEEDLADTEAMEESQNVADVEEDDEDESKPNTSSRHLRSSARRNLTLREDREEEGRDRDMYDRLKRRRMGTSGRQLSPSPETRGGARRKLPSQVFTTPEADESNQSFADVRHSDNNKMPREEEGEEEEEPRQYLLRRQRNPVSRFEVTLPEPRSRLQTRERPPHADAFHSPAHRRSRNTLSRRRLERRSRSTSSSDSDNDRENGKFERRKIKSLERAKRRFLPLNIEPSDARSGVLKERLRAQTGASCTDIDPMGVDRSVGFDQVGGLTHHVQALKEMVLFPMLYSDVFKKFNLAPPRGVIFYGPPGTGKTLVARALANECSREDKKVAFFMRKGADCLSKWVGESERQLRLLFDQAYSMRPSIIFFDELDGLAPVRSSRQDQIHSSIVSTLLALMDGLDGRGEVVVIGATNRLDCLDPALRRPGRFDRELKFALPDQSARQTILSIHTRQWADASLSSQDLLWLANSTSGYCGADLKGLCTEAVLIALRKKYPQIYMSRDKLQLDASQVKVSRNDFMDAMKQMVPSSRRDMSVVSRSLSDRSACLLSSVISKILAEKIPFGYQNKPSSSHSLQMEELNNVLRSFDSRKTVPSARLLICGRNADMGQTSHLAPALLNAMDHLSVHSLAIANVYASSNKSPEESVAEKLHNAQRSGASTTAAGGGPCLVFIPAIDTWLNVMPVTVWHTLMSVVDAWDGFTSILLLATSHRDYDNSPAEIRTLFRRSEMIEIFAPSAAQRKTYFTQVIVHQATIKPNTNNGKVEQLALAGPEPIRMLSEWELKEIGKQKVSILRELRIFLREMIGRLIRDRRFSIFAKPVDAEDAPDYFQIITQPMDLSTIMDKIDQNKYDSVSAFLNDIYLITTNALEYNPNRDQADKLIRHRAALLKDTADAMIDSELDWEFEKRLQALKKVGQEQRDIIVEPPTDSSVSDTKSVSKGHYCQPEQSFPCFQQEEKKTVVFSVESEKGIRGRGNSVWCKRKRRKVLGNERTARHGNARQRASAAILRKYRSRRQRPLREGLSARKQDESRDNKLPSPEPQHLIVPMNQLTELVEQATSKTSGWSVGPLERLSARLSAVTDSFKDVWDRTNMIPLLETIIRQARLD